MKRQIRQKNGRWAKVMKVTDILIFLLLIKEEAFRLSGEHDPQAAIRFFRIKKYHLSSLQMDQRIYQPISDGRFFQ